MATRSKRWNYFVAVEFQYLKKPNEIKYVTSLDNSNRMAHWDYDQEAMPMSLVTAEDIVYGLVCNYYRAYIIKAPSTFEFRNPPKEEKDGREI